MLAKVQYIGALASAGTATVNIPVPSGARHLEIHLVSSGAASATIKKSLDGTTFVTSAIPAISAAAGVDGSVVVNLNDSPYKTDAGPIVAVQVDLLAGSADVQVCVLTENEFERGL